MDLSHEDAEGVVQEVFLKIWKNRSKLDPELSINAYLIAIVRSLVIKKAKNGLNLATVISSTNSPIQTITSNKIIGVLSAELKVMSLL